MQWIGGCCSLSTSLLGYCLIWIHLGSSVPSYVEEALSQARLFHPHAQMYLVAEEKERVAFRSVEEEQKIIWVDSASLKPSAEHLEFQKRSSLESHSLGGFWFYTTERFFYLEELIEKEGLKDVIHLENDVMVYRDFSELLDILQKHYPQKMGALFEAEDRCVPGLLYIPHQEPLKQLNAFLVQRADRGETDMQSLGAFRKEHPEWIEDLPVFPTRLIREVPMRYPCAQPERFCRHFEEFQSLFDAAALGQYWGGTSPFHEDGRVPLYINPYIPFWICDAELLWERDVEGRWVPWVVWLQEKIRVNNLHIHSKELELVHSLKDKRPSRISQVGSG